MTLTEKIARFIVETDYNRIPLPAIDLAKKAVIDCLGVSLGGSTMLEGRRIAQYVKDIGGTREAVVIGAGFRAPAHLASLANGTMASAPDSSDTSLTWNIAHPSEVILPTVLALCDRHKMSGKQLLTAYVIGFEVGSRIGTGLVWHYERGWHSTATVGTFASTASAAKLLGLDIHQVQMALGTAGSMAFGLKQNFGTMTRAFHAGKAAQNGITAAQLASNGFTANPDIFEGPISYTSTMGGSESSLEKAIAGLGKSFDIIAPGGLNFKFHASCYLTHWCIDAMLYLKSKFNIKASNVDRITCRLPRVMLQTLICPRPQTGNDGMLSMEYCIAAVLLDGNVGLERFTDEKVRRPEAQALLSRVECISPEDTTKLTLAEAFRYPNSVTVRLMNGTEYTHAVSYPKGDIRNPMTIAECEAKFNQFASSVLAPETRQEIIDMIWKLETLESISDLTDLLLHSTSRKRARTQKVEALR